MHGAGVRRRAPARASGERDDFACDDERAEWRELFGMAGMARVKLPTAPRRVRTVAHPERSAAPRLDRVSSSRLGARGGHTPRAAGLALVTE